MKIIVKTPLRCPLKACLHRAQRTHVLGAPAETMGKRTGHRYRHQRLPVYTPQGTLPTGSHGLAGTGGWGSKGPGRP